MSLWLFQANDQNLRDLCVILVFKDYLVLIKQFEPSDVLKSVNLVKSKLNDVQVEEFEAEAMALVIMEQELRDKDEELQSTVHSYLQQSQVQRQLLK